MDVVMNGALLTGRVGKDLGFSLYINISPLRGADPCFITNSQSPIQLAYVPKDIVVAENLFIIIGSRTYSLFYKQPGGCIICELHFRVGKGH